MARKKDYDFAFLAHSRDVRDVHSVYPITRFLPDKLIELWCRFWPPVFVCAIKGLKSKKTNKEIKGCVLAIPMTAKQMLKYRRAAGKKAAMAVKKAEKLGAGYIGLGAFTSTVTAGGADIRAKKAFITNGNALTSAAAFSHLRDIINKFSNIEKIGIIGATGSIGQAISRLLVKNFPDKEYYLFARSEKTMKELSAGLREISPKTKIHERLGDISDAVLCDLAVAATAAADVLIEPRHLKENAVVYDVTQPRNISDKALEERKDARIFDGGLVRISRITKKLPLGTEPTVFFACLAETMLLALDRHQGNFSIGKVKLEQVEYIERLAGEYDFRPLDIFQPKH